MKLLLLSKENVPMAKGEAEAILGDGKLIDNVLLLNTKKKTNRLAYTRMILNLLFEADNNNIGQKIKKFNWNKAVKGSFALSFLENHDQISQSLSRKYGGMIYDLLKSPKVDLDDPKTKILIIESNKKLFIGTLEWENNEGFHERSPDLRPGHQPVTVTPRFARACVNLTGSNSQIYDPFCGVGGFLIEAGLMKLKVIGSDYEEKMLHLCKKNLNHYKIRNYKIFKQDALKIKKRYDYIVTDPPYGKGSKVIGKDLYSNFIKTLNKCLTKRAVVIFPHYIKAQNLLKNNKLKIRAKYPFYIHKSLTREVFVLEK